VFFPSQSSERGPTATAYQTSWCSWTAKHLWGPLTVLLLFLSATTQREWQAFHGRSGQEGAGGDFSVYYVAGKVACGDANRRLYYYPSGPLNRREISVGFFQALVPAGSPWQEAAHRSGLNDTQFFNYPPFFALLFAPIALLRFSVAFFLWRVLSMALVILSIFVVLKIITVRPFFLVFSFCVVGALSFFPVVEMLHVGQVGSLILFLWSLGAYFQARNRDLLSGFVFAIGTLVKLTPAVVVPIFLLRRRWRWLAGFALGLLIPGVLSIALLGWRNHVLYFGKVLPAVSCGVNKLENKSITALVLQLVLGSSYFGINSTVSGSRWEAACLAAKVVSLVIYIGLLFWSWQRRTSKTEIVDEVILFALVSLLISPVSWRHHYVLALLPLFALWSKFVEAEAIPLQDCLLLLFATIAIGGSPLGDLLVPHVRSSAVRIVLASPILIGAVLSIWVYIRISRRVRLYPIGS
jgi:glycosyl transferase family 87